MLVVVYCLEYYRPALYFHVVWEFYCEHKYAVHWKCFTLVFITFLDLPYVTSNQSSNKDLEVLLFPHCAS